MVTSSMSLAGDPRFGRARLALLALAENPSACEKITSHLHDLLAALKLERLSSVEAQDREHALIAEKLNGFDMKSSRPYQYFVQRQWETLGLDELLGIATVMCHCAGIRLNRESKRRKPVLFKWLDENWDRLLPVADNVKIALDGTIQN
jgi:hypothetical protein